MENTKKSFGEIWAKLTTEQREYLKGYIDRQRQDAVKHYQAEQLRIGSVSKSVNCEHPMSERADILNSSRTYCLKCSTTL